MVAQNISVRGTKGLVFSKDTYRADEYSREGHEGARAHGGSVWRGPLRPSRHRGRHKRKLDGIAGAVRELPRVRRATLFTQVFRLL